MWQIIRNLFCASRLPIIPHSVLGKYEADIAKLTRAELVLLSQFKTPQQLKAYGINGAWKKVLKKEPEILLSRFVKNSWLVKAPLEDQIRHLPASEMKERLKALGQKVSGTKDVLAKRLVDADPNIATSLSGEMLWCCSDVAIPIVIDFLKKEEDILLEAKAEAKKALDDGNLLQVAQVAARYDAQRLFASIDPMFPSMDKEDVHKKLKFLSSIKNKRPRAFKDIPDDIMDKAVELHMWDMLWKERTSGIDADTKRLILNISTWVYGKEFVDKTKSEIKTRAFRTGIKIMGCDECEASQSCKDKTYSLSNLPEIPMPGCDRFPCCGCCYTEIILTN